MSNDSSRTVAHESVQPGLTRTSFIVRYYDRSPGYDLLIDQTSVDEENETLIWELFEEFGHTRTDDTFYQIEPIPEQSELPNTGWHDNDIFSVSYKDIEVLIDRQIDGEVEIRVWQNGKEEYTPHAQVSFKVDRYVCGNCCHDDGRKGRMRRMRTLHELQHVQIGQRRS